MSNEVFLMVNDEYEEVATEITVCDTLDELNMQLESESYGNLDDEIKIFHGVFVSARFIPNDFKGCTPYIFIRNPYGVINANCSGEAHWEKMKGDPETLALAIEELIKERTYQFENGNEPVTIDHVKIFLGHEVQKVFHVPEDHIDEELIDRVSKLADFIEQNINELEEGDEKS